MKGVTKVRLEIGGGPIIDNPSRDQIADTLYKMHQGEGEFAILFNEDLGDDYYIQTTGDIQNGYLLENHEGSSDRHYQAMDRNLPIERVVEAFQKYAAGDARWKDGLEWEPVDLSGSKAGCLGMAALLLAGAFAHSL